MGLFSSSNSIQLPNTPTFYSDPYVGLSESQLFDQGGNLTSGKISDLPDYLKDVVSLHPEITQLMLQGLTSQLEPYHRQGLQDITNTLEANNQLTGSTTASALGNFENDYQNQLTTAGANAGINDINRALAARLQVYNMGLGATGQAGQLGLTNQSQVNSFNLENYQNEVAKTLAGQKPSTGGFLGALTGAIGGGLAGFAVGGPIGAGIGAIGGGLSGGFGPSGTGGQFLQAGASTYGASKYLNGLNGPNAIIPSSNVGSINGNNEQIQDILKGSPTSGSQYINKWYGGM